MIRRADSPLQVERCFWGPNPYSRDAVLKCVWSDSYLSDAGLISGIAAMAHASSHVIASQDTNENSADDRSELAASWLTDWSLAFLNAERGHLKSCGTRREKQRLVSWIGYHDPNLSLEVLRFAADSLEAFSRSQHDPEQFLNGMELRLQACRRLHPDFQAKYLMEAADHLNIPYMPVASVNRCWQYGWGKKSVLSFETGIAENSYIFHNSSSNKPATKALLRSLGLPVGRDIVARSDADLQRAIEHVGFPCVTKPTNGKRSQNVSLGITSSKSLLEGFKRARDFSDGPVLVEQMLEGEVHRLMVLRGKYFCSVRRVPPRVIGDGTSTIEELLDQREAARLADRARVLYTSPVPRDDELTKKLEQNGLTLQSCLSVGQSLELRSIPLVGVGSELSDLTESTHETVKQMAITIADFMRLPSIGIDYVTADITLPPSSSCGFLEVNSVPSFRIPLAAGFSLDECARALLGEDVGRIPATLEIVSPETMLASRRAEDKDPGVGWVHGNACGVGSMSLSMPNASTLDCTRAVLRNPHTERIEVAMATEELHRFGLPLDRFDQINFSGIEDESLADWQPVLERASETLVRPSQ